MKSITNDELCKIQGGNLMAISSYFLMKKLIKFIVRNLKLLTN